MSIKISTDGSTIINIKTEVETPYIPDTKHCFRYFLLPTLLKHIQEIADEICFFECNGKENPNCKNCQIQQIKNLIEKYPPQAPAQGPEKKADPQ